MLHKTVRGNKTEADNFKQDTCARNKLDNYAPGKMNDGKNSLINPEDWIYFKSAFKADMIHNYVRPAIYFLRFYILF